MRKVGKPMSPEPMKIIRIQKFFFLGSGSGSAWGLVAGCSFLGVVLLRRGLGGRGKRRGRRRNHFAGADPMAAPRAEIIVELPARSRWEALFVNGLRAAAGRAIQG